MQDYATTLTGIEYKVKQLIEENMQLKEQVWNMTAQKENLTEEVEQQKNEINKLKQQLDITKLRNALTQKGDSTEIKLKINQLIRSIDKSLELLNKIE